MWLWKTTGVPFGCTGNRVLKGRLCSKSFHQAWLRLVALAWGGASAAVIKAGRDQTACSCPKLLLQALASGGPDAGCRVSSTNGSAHRCKSGACHTFATDQPGNAELAELTADVRPG